MTNTVSTVTTSTTPDLSWYRVRLVVPGTDGDAENGPCEPQGWEDYVQAPDEKTAIELANKQAREDWEAPNYYAPEVEAPSDKEMGQACPVCEWAETATEEEYKAWKEEMDSYPESPFD